MKKLMLFCFAAFGLSFGASAGTVDLSRLSRSGTLGDGVLATGTLAGNYKISIAAGATVTISNATINGANDSNCNWAGLTCEGNATIIVEGSNDIKGFCDNYPGIYVPQGSTLTILGGGTLNASNNGHAAGIGGGFDQACGNIVISNATVIATGRDTSAGIGGGGYSACGDITIGGRANVTATGGAWAAGIGSGVREGGIGGTCGTIRIVGGTINATGGSNARGIGCGQYGSCTRVEIGRGITLVTATAGDNGLPIYGSDSDRISQNLASVVSDNTRTLKWDGNLAGLLSDNTESVTATDGTTIYGQTGYEANVCIAPDATVTLDNAWNTYASGPKGKWAALTCLGNATIILSGENYMYAYHEDYPGIYVPEGCTLTIRGSGSLRAMGGGLVDEYNNVRGGGAGIGGGNAINCGNIVIEGGTITALGKSYAAGIGCGNGGSCGNITIRGGTVTATGSTQGGAGIGSAFALSTYSATCGDITIEGGTVNATGSTASAGIGAGNLGRCGNIAISGGTVTATGTGAGIGAGNQGRCGNITFTGGETTATSTDSASGSAGVGCGYQAICDAIAISGGILTATGAGTGAGIGTGGSSGTAHTGAITVSGSITRVVATRGEDCTNDPIGAGSSGGYTGTVTVQTGLSDKTVGQTRTIQWSGNLNGITFSPTAGDGAVITGTRGYSCPQVSIAPGATVTLRDATLDATASSSGSVGLKCLGSATIILEGSNYVKGVMGYPGIYVPFGSTLTIKGSGKLSAYGGTSAAGIGGGYGGGDYEKCGQIKIDGGVIYAQGGGNAAGIGSGVGHGAYSDAIWIEKHVISVTAKSSTAGNPIGAGKEAMNASVNVYPGLDDDQGAPIRTITCWDGNLATLTHGALALDGTVIHGTLGGQYGVSIADGATVTLSNAVINSCLDGEDDNYDWAGLTCSGDATIILKETNVVKGFYEDNPGIFVPFGHTLTITGDGSLTASSNGYGAGIGGGYERGCGNIVIAGGTITATGGNQGAAGIGGGYAHDSTTCGNITISGGTVTATGGRYAAGIGCGIETSCGDIDIRGGTVVARGGENGAGIGGGYDSSCGDIDVDDGCTIDARGGMYAAGIGCGYNENAQGCGKVKIGSFITRVVARCGTDGKPLGAGKDTSSGVVSVSPSLFDDLGTTVRTITCWDGNLSTLNKDTWAMDGMVIYGTLTGQYRVTIAAGATVTLSNATITCGQNNQSYSWAGLMCHGSATIILKETNVVKGFYEDYPGIYVPSASTLTIRGSGSLEASSNGYGAGIGGGYNLNCGNIRIEGGVITATGGQWAAGIGGGGFHVSGSTVVRCGYIEISGGDVSAEGGFGGAGIGGGRFGTCGNITVGAGIVRVVAEANQNGGGNPIGASYSGSCGTVTVHPSLIDDRGTPIRTITHGGPSGGWNGDLSTLTQDATAQDGTVIYGTLAGDYKVSIAAGATVTLSNATITCCEDGENFTNSWAGLTCEGDATIILKETNAVKGFYEDYPGIHVPVGSTLTIRGSGSLTASSNGYGAGIGGGFNLSCGNIVIEGGVITAMGGVWSAGIGGGGFNSSGSGVRCGYIEITGGDVTAQSENNGAGIGGGAYGTCGNITVGAGIVRVVAQKNGGGVPIGAGQYGECGTVTVASGLHDDLGSPTRVISRDAPWNGDLAALTQDATVQDGMVIFGTLTTNVQVSIAAGATVTISNAVINRTGEYFDSPGLRCLGDATILLDGANNISGFDCDRSGIFVPVSYRLVISNLNANASLAILRTDLGGAGIGGGYDESCGDIDIYGGVITVVGGYYSAGIGGGGQGTSCGTIRIMSGTITATGGFRAAGIGSSMGGSCTGVVIEGGTVSAEGGGYGDGIGAGHNNGSSHPASCGYITISSGIARVTATRGSGSDSVEPEPIGHGAGAYSTCGTPTVDPSLTDTTSLDGNTRTITSGGSSSGYTAWATANGVSGAWNATDANGIVNVFRYAFNKPTGAFTEPVLLDITFNAAGKAVIKTPPLVNTTGFTFTIVASDNLDGTGTAASYGLNASGETTIDETGKTKRFFRLRAVEQ